MHVGCYSTCIVSIAVQTLGSLHTVCPCIMCAGALLNARVKTLVFGAADLKAGAASSLYNVCSDPRLNHNTDVIHGVFSIDCENVITKFFKIMRDKNIIDKRV